MLSNETYIRNINDNLSPTLRQSFQDIVKRYSNAHTEKNQLEDKVSLSLLLEPLYFLSCNTDMLTDAEKASKLLEIAQENAGLFSSCIHALKKINLLHFEHFIDLYESPKSEIILIILSYYDNCREKIDKFTFKRLIAHPNLDELLNVFKTCFDNSKKLHSPDDKEATVIFDITYEMNRWDKHPEYALGGVIYYSNILNLKRTLTALTTINLYFSSKNIKLLKFSMNELLSLLKKVDIANNPEQVSMSDDIATFFEQCATLLQNDTSELLEPKSKAIIEAQGALIFRNIISDTESKPYQLLKAINKIAKFTNIDFSKLAATTMINLLKQWSGKHSDAATDSFCLLWSSGLLQSDNSYQSASLMWTNHIRTNSLEMVINYKFHEHDTLEGGMNPSSFSNDFSLSLFYSSAGISLHEAEFIIDKATYLLALHNLKIENFSLISAYAVLELLDDGLVDNDFLNILNQIIIKYLEPYPELLTNKGAALFNARKSPQHLFLRKNLIPSIKKLFLAGYLDNETGWHKLSFLYQAPDFVEIVRLLGNYQWDKKGLTLEIIPDDWLKSMTRDELIGIIDFFRYADVGHFEKSTKIFFKNKDIKNNESMLKELSSANRKFPIGALNWYELLGRSPNPQRLFDDLKQLYGLGLLGASKQEPVNQALMTSRKASSLAHTLVILGQRKVIDTHVSAEQLAALDRVKHPNGLSNLLDVMNAAQLLRANSFEVLFKKVGTRRYLEARAILADKLFQMNVLDRHQFRRIMKIKSPRPLKGLIHIIQKCKLLQATHEQIASLLDAAPSLFHSDELVQLVINMKAHFISMAQMNSLVDFCKKVIASPELSDEVLILELKVIFSIKVSEWAVVNKGFFANPSVVVSDAKEPLTKQLQPGAI